MTDIPIPEDFDDFRGESFQKGHAPADVDQELVGLVFVLDVQESFPSIVRLRDWAMDKVAPQPGDVCVDVGCGTGAEVRRMAGLVGETGRVVGVEPHPGLRTVAAQRASEQGVGAEFVDGDAVSLPFDDDSVDVIRCERVFQHLPDPQGAVAEMARVLRPGGRVVLIDSDWATAVARPGDADVFRRLLESTQRRTPNPFAGRHLRAQLSQAGLVTDPDLGSTAVVFADSLLADPTMLRSLMAPAVEEGSLSAAEATQLEHDLGAAAAMGEAMLAVTMFGAVARKEQRQR